jgi:adenosylcobyric acid synthase
MRAIMIQGTASDVGKSVLCTALCRIFYEDGIRVAPFKSQNMALNSYVTQDGREIGRAQGVQAEAAGVIATVDMNPILLKPKGSGLSEVIVHGKRLADVNYHSYRGSFHEVALRSIQESIDRLKLQFDLLVVEGAGSPAEVNLNDREVVNMRIARMLDAPVLLVTDIDRGGAFASLVGTLELLEPEDRRRVKGMIINKFRGAYDLLEPGIRWLEEKTGIPVVGVIPYVEHSIEAEDSLALGSLALKKGDVSPWDLDIAVIEIPFISNFTDLDPLRQEPGVHLRFVRSRKEFGRPHLVILPGSKNSIEDLKWLYQTGIYEQILHAYQNGAWVMGICGGYQMLGRELIDPLHVESNEDRLQGLGLLDTTTTYIPTKTTVRRNAMVVHGPCAGESVEGFEIHLGQTERGENVAPFLQYENVYDGAVSPCGRVTGTYLHHIFHNRRFTRRFLNHIRQTFGLSPVDEQLISDQELREREYTRIAAHVRKHLDMNAIYQLIFTNKFSHQE